MLCSRSTTVSFPSLASPNIHKHRSEREMFLESLQGILNEIPYDHNLLRKNNKTAYIVQRKQMATGKAIRTARKIQTLFY